MQKKILIVEDDPPILEFLAFWLTKQDYEISTAEDGLSALEKIKTDKPDLILLDVMLPQMDGFEVCKKIRADENTKNIPVIFVTCKDAIEDIEKGFNVGGNDYVTKPIDNNHLLGRIKKILAE
ncbi:MAG: response regulator [Elusimicrobiota bacterium]